MSSPSESVPVFAALYFDEDVSIHVVRAIQGRGFDATCALDRGTLGLTDIEQLRLASEEKRALVTHNRRDYEKLHQQCLSEERRHSGVILLMRRLDDRVIVRNLLKLLDQLTADEIENRLFFA